MAPHAIDLERPDDSYAYSSSTYETAPTQIFAAAVVGGGPGGIAALGNLLEQVDGGKIAWIDPSFEGGRIHSKYCDVPSNTRVSLFLDYARAVEPFRQIVETTAGPNAITALEELEQDKPCQLKYAADMIRLLSEGLMKNERVEAYSSKLTEAEWDVIYLVTHSQNRLNISDESSHYLRLVLCTGASPRQVNLPTSSSVSEPIPLDLDTCLAPTALVKTLPTSTPITVGLIGSSHSAILVLLNLFTLTQSSHPNLRINWFSRSPHLKYAQYMDGWIMYDNTGLKGSAAQFARENLEGDVLARSPVGKVCERIDCSGGSEREGDAMRHELPRCQYVVQAVGYDRNPLPVLRRRGEGKIKEPAFQHETGRFRDAKGREVEGLFGAGIAFPEKVVDKAGNVEYAVGFWKFMRFLKGVVPQWVDGTA